MMIDYIDNIMQKIFGTKYFIYRWVNPEADCNIDAPAGQLEDIVNSGTACCMAFWLIMIPFSRWSTTYLTITQISKKDYLIQRELSSDERRDWIRDNI